MNYLEKFEYYRYSIYDWFEDLKISQWSDNKKIAESKLKKDSDHFIGPLVFDKVVGILKKFWVAFNKADAVNLHYRMYDVYDEIVPLSKEKYTIHCVAYGRYEEYNKKLSEGKCSGLITVRNPEKNDYYHVLVHILMDIIYPTLFIGGYPSVPIRLSSDEIYVTDPKWNCKNFDISNYSIKENDMFDANGNRLTGGELIRRRDVCVIFSSAIKNKKLYSVDKVISMYHPCLLVNIGGYENSHLSGKMDLKKLEYLIDDALTSALPELDYADIQFDYSRHARSSEHDMDVYDYELKIFLNY